MWHFLITIAGTGEPIRLCRSSVEVKHSKTGAIVPYIGAITDLSPPTWGADNSDATITVDREAFDLIELRVGGVTIGGAPAEVALWKDGSDFDDRMIVLAGEVAAEEIERSRSDVSMTLKEPEGLASQTFPPYRIERTLQANSTATNEIWMGFPSLPDSERGKVFNVIYGRAKNVPLVMLDAVTVIGEDSVVLGLPFGNEVAFPIPTTDTTIRWALAGHRLRSRTVTLRINETTFGSAYTVPVLYARDFQTGATYAYVELSTAAVAEGINRITADVVEGYEDDNGSLITGLGDIVVHAIRNYSGLTPAQVDWERLARFVPRANSLGLSMILGGESSTFLDVIKGRIEAQFPVSFSFRGGRLGADWEVFDWEGPPVRRLRFDRQGGDFIDRVDPVEMHNSEGRSDRFTVEYDPDPYGIKRPGVPVFKRVMHTQPAVGPLVIEEVSNAMAAIANAMPDGVVASSLAGHIAKNNMITYGAISSFATVELVDVVEQDTAGLIVFGLRDRWGVIRTAVRYIGELDLLRYLPLKERYLLTDDAMRWVDEPFRLEQVTFREDGLATALLVSFNEAV